MSSKKSPLIWFLVFLIAAVLAAVFAPLEKTLGVNARFVYFHGAWVWTAMLAFLASAVGGLAGLLSKRLSLHHWSLALGRAGLIFWIAFLPMSLYAMQANWNGLFLDEPRFRVPLNFAIVGLLMQVGLSFLAKPALISAGNLIFGLVFFLGMSQIDTVLHPDSPILRSGSTDIKLYFLVLVFLLSLAAWQLASCWFKRKA